MRFGSTIPFILAALSIAIPLVVAIPRTRGDSLYVRDAHVKILARMLEPAVEEYLNRRSPIWPFISKGKGKASAPNFPDGDVRNRLSFIDASRAAIGHKEVAAQNAADKERKDAKAAAKAKSNWGKLKTAVKSGGAKVGNFAEKAKNTVAPPKPLYPGPDEPRLIGWKAVQEHEAKFSEKDKKRLAKLPAWNADGKRVN